MENKQQNIKQILTLAYEHHLKNNLKLAENLYNKILKLDNKNLDALFLLGTLNLQKKIFLNAIELFNKVLKRNPNHIQGLHNLAYAYIEIGKHLDAEKLLHKVIEIQ